MIFLSPFIISPMEHIPQIWKLWSLYLCISAWTVLCPFCGKQNSEMLWKDSHPQSNNTPFMTPKCGWSCKYRMNLTFKDHISLCREKTWRSKSWPWVNGKGDYPGWAHLLVNPEKGLAFLKQEIEGKEFVCQFWQGTNCHSLRGSHRQKFQVTSNSWK